MWASQAVFLGDVGSRDATNWALCKVKVIRNPRSGSISCRARGLPFGPLVPAAVGHLAALAPATLARLRPELSRASARARAGPAGLARLGQAVAARIQPLALRVDALFTPFI